LGLSVYTYPAAWLLLPLVIGFVLYLRVFAPRRVAGHWRGLLLAGVIAVLIMAPLAIHFGQHPEQLTMRSGQVAITSPGPQGNNMLAAIGANLLKALGMFSVAGDIDPRNNVPGMPALDLLMAIPFYLGLALVAIRVADRWQWTIAGLAIFPPLLVQAATLGYDAVTLGGVLLAIGVVSRLRRTRARDAPVLLAAGLLLALAKPPYYLLMAPVAFGLFVRRRWLTGVGAALPVGVGLAWSLVLAPGFDGPVPTILGTIQPDPDAHLARILGDPLGFLWHGVGGVIRSVPIDHLPHWAFADTPVVVAWIGLAVTTLVALAGGRDPGPGGGGSTSPGERLLALAAVCLLATAITAAEYLYFTAPATDGSPAGFGGLTPQWRYLAPLLGPLLVALPRLPRIRASLGLPVVAMGAASSAVGYLMALS